MKIKILFNKFIALTVTVCLLVSITSVDIFSAEKNKSFSQYENINSLPLVSPENGKITSINDTGSDLTVVNIQDLHCHKETQKKISNIIEEINKENKVNKIYVEGGYGNIDISWLNSIEDKKIKEQILEQLLDDGEITAGEYYAALKNNTVKLKGLDKEEIHQQNIERLSKIMDNQEKYDSIIQKVRIEIDRLNKMYVNLENRKFSQGINNYKHKGGDSGQFYIKLFKYIDKINNNFDKYNNITKISKDDYPNMAAYITLDEESKKIKPEEISSQIQTVLGDLKAVLSYEQYLEIITKTNNLKDIVKLAWYINKYTTEKNIDLAKYGTLNKFLTIKKLNQNLNPVELLEEERNLIEKIRFALSYDKTEYEVAFLSDFEEYFEKYLKYGLTSQDWAWTKKGFKKFRNLYAKYSVIDRIKEIEEDFVEIDKYYDINDQRNSIFVDNILDGEKTAVKIKKPGVRTSKEIIKDSKEVIIVIAGGYHSNELADVLSQKMINDMVITPNITGNIEKANDKYKRTIKEQAIMESQALAFRLASCSDDITQQKLLLKAGIEALKKNNGTVTAEEIESIIKFVKNEDENVDIKYENGVIELNGNKIPIEEITAPLNEGLESFSFLYWNAVIEAAITPFKESVKDLSFDKFEGFYKHNINKILFPIVTSISESDGFLSFEAEQVFETFKELYKEGIIIDDERYSLEEFAKLPLETQSKFVQKEFLDIKKHDTVALESIISEPVIRYCNGYGIKLSDKQKDVLERKTEEIVKYILENKQIKEEYLDEEYETTDGKTIKMLDILLGYYNSRFMWTRRKYGLDNFEIKKQLAKYKTEHFIEEYIDKFGEISNAEEKILRQALSKMFTHNEIFGVEYAVKPFNLSVDSINRDMLSFAVENNINDFAAYQLIFVKGLKIENDQQKTKLLKLIAEVNNKFVDTNLAIENDGLAIKIILKDERINEDNMFREYIKLSKNSRNIRSIMTEEDFDYMMRLLDSDDKEAFNNFNSIFEEYISKISEVGKNSVVADENTEVFIYTGYDDIGKNIFDEEVVATVFRKLGIEIDTGIWAKNKLGVNVFGGEENPRYKKFADDKNSDAYWNLFVESLTKFIEDNEYKIKNKEIKILVYIDTHGNVDNISLFNRFPSREYNEVKFIDDVGKVVNLLPEGSTTIVDSCHSGEFELNILREYPEIKSNMIASTSPQHDIGYFVVNGFLIKTITGDTDTYSPWFSNLLYSIDNSIEYNKKANYTMYDNSLATPKGVLHTGFVTGAEVEKINKETSVKLHNLVNLYRNKDKYDDKQFNDEVEKIQQKTELYKNDEDNFLKVEREQEDLPDYGKNRYYARHRPNVAELSIRENDKTAPVWEELVFGTAITALIAVFIISNPFGWLTGIVAAGLFTTARLGFIGIHSVVEYFKYGKDKNEIRKNFMARLLPTTILSIPYAVALLSMGTFIPGLLMATGIAILLHGYWNDNEETIKNYLSKIPLVKNLPYVKMLIGNESKYQAVENGTFPFSIVGIKSNDKMNNNYILFLILTYLNGLSGYKQMEMVSYLSKENILNVSDKFIENIIENKDAKNLNNYDLKSLITGILLTLYPDKFEELFNGNYDNILQNKLAIVKNAEFNDVITKDFPKEALANSQLEFRTFEYKEKNTEQDDDLALPYRNTLIGLITDAVHELRHIELEGKNKNYPGFLPEFYAETGSVLDVLKLAQKCKTKEEKEEFYKTLPIHYNFQLLSSEHRTARAFNQIFFDVFETDISKWEALEDIIFNVNTGKDEKTPIEYIEVIINEMEKYTDENGNNVFDTADIEQIENKMEANWQYLFYKIIKDDTSLRKEIDKKIESGKITINVEEKNKSAYTNKWLYPGYECLASNIYSPELIETILKYYEKNSDKKTDNYYKIVYLKTYDLFKEGFEISFNSKEKPSIDSYIETDTYRNKMKKNEIQLLSRAYDLDLLYKDLKKIGIPEDNLKTLNYGRIMQNQNNNFYLKDIINDKSLETEFRLLAYGYIMANNNSENLDGILRSLFNLQDLKIKTKVLLSEYVDGNKKIENDVDLRAVGVGVALTLLDEKYTTEYETEYGTMSKYMPFINLNAQQSIKLYGKILQSNIVEKGKGIGATSRMFFSSVAVKSIAHEIGHNIFDYKQGKNKNITLQELAADVSASMLMQILGKDVIKNVNIKDYGNKLFANGTIKNGIEFSFLEEHNAADGLIFLLFTTIDRYLGAEMSFSEFFKILLEVGARDAGEIGYNDLRNKSQSTSIINVIDYYIAYLKDKYKDDADKINKLEQVIKEVDSWKVIIPEIIADMETENRNINLYNFIITLISTNLIPEESYWQYKDNRERIENVFVAARSEQERHLIIYNSLFYPSNLVILANVIENYMNTLSETHIKTITLEVLKNKDINLYNIDMYGLSKKEKDVFRNKIKENLSDMEKNILVKLIIIKDELDETDKFVLRTLLEEKGVSNSQIDEWLKDNVISGPDKEDGGAQLKIRVLFGNGMRSSLSYDEREYVMSIIDSDKEDVLEALYAEQEMVLKLKIVSNILIKVEGKFVTKEDVYKTVERIFEKTSEDETITEKDLDDGIIIETLEEILSEGYEKDQGLVSSALLPENQRTIYEWMRDKNFESSFIEKLKKSVEMAWKEFSPSLYSSFSRRHFEKDSNTAKKLQNITKASAVISAITSGIIMFWLNPTNASVIVVRIAILAFSVIGITSIITFLTNMITHTRIIYNFMGAIEKNEILRENLKETIYKTGGWAAIDLSNEEFSMSDEQNRKELRNTIEDFVKKCDNEGKKGKIIINEAQKQALGHYQIGINTSYLAEKNIYMYVKQKDGEEILISKTKPEDSTAILPKTEQYVNKSVSAGKSPFRISLGVALKEFLEVYKVRSFYKEHKPIEARLMALKLSAISYLIPSIIGVAGLLMPAIPLTTVLIAFIASIFASNIGVHTILDFKEIKTMKELDDVLNEAVNKYEGEEEIAMPVYVVSDGIGKFGKELKNIGLKTAKGESLFAVKTEGAIVLGTRSGASAKDVAQVLNESKVLEDLIKDKIGKNIDVKLDIVVEDKKYIEQNKVKFGNSNVIFEEGIMIVEEIKSTNSEEIKEEFRGLSAVKQTIGFTLADKMITSFENETPEEINKFIKNSNGMVRVLITESQREVLKQENINLQGKGICVKGTEGNIKDFDTGEEIDYKEIKPKTAQELQTEILTSSVSLVIEKNKLEEILGQGDMLDINNMFETLIGNIKTSFGIGQLIKKDVETMAYNTKYEKIKAVKNWEELKDSDEIKIIYESIKDETKKQKFKDIIESRIKAKEIIEYAGIVYTEQNREVKSLEKILIKAIQEQKEINFEGIKKEKEKIKEETESNDKSLEQNKIDLWNLIGQQTEEKAIATMLYLMDIIADESKQANIVEKGNNNIAKDYRAMLAAA